MVQNDCLLRGFAFLKSSKNARRQLLLFPNRLEMPSESLLVPIDEILGVTLSSKGGDNQQTILIKSTRAKTELALLFEWRFEAEVSKVLNNSVKNTTISSNGTAIYHTCGRMCQNCQKTHRNNSQSGAASRTRSKTRKRSPWPSTRSAPSRRPRSTCDEANEILIFCTLFIL